MSSKTEKGGFLPRLRNAAGVTEPYGLMTDPATPTFPRSDSGSRLPRWISSLRSGINKADTIGNVDTFVKESGTQEVSPVVHPMQQLAVEADFARSFFDACNKNYKQERSMLRQGNPGKAKKDLKMRHVEGLIAAYLASRSIPEAEESERMAQFRATWGAKSDYLLEQVGSFLPELEEKRTVALASAGNIEPYDVKLAKRRAQRTRIGLPRAQRILFDDISGIEPKKRLQQFTELGTTILTALGSMFAVDAAAGAIATPINDAHFQLLETADMKFLIPAAIVTYAPLIHSIYKSIGANTRLSKETGISTNFGYAAGDKVTQAIGVNEGSSDKASLWGQGSFETIKDGIWLAGISTTVALHHMTPRDALIFGAFANLGGAVYEYTVAQGVNKALDIRRNIYNRKYPFPVLGEENSEIDVAPVNESPVAITSLSRPVPATVLFSSISPNGVSK